MGGGSGVTSCLSVIFGRAIFSESRSSLAYIKMAGDVPVANAIVGLRRNRGNRYSIQRTTDVVTTSVVIRAQNSLCASERP